MPRRQPLRPVTDAGRADPSSPVPPPEGRHDAPLVYLTMGTVAASIESMPSPDEVAALLETMA